MKFAFPAVAAVSVLGALPFITQDGHENEHIGPELVAYSMPAQEAKASLLSYKLRVSGREGSCTVVKRGAVEAVQAELDLNDDCIALMPRLSEARYWQENSAGDLRFVAADGRSVIEFFAADGVAYESLRPMSPLVVLTAQ